MLKHSSKTLQSKYCKNFLVLYFIIYINSIGWSQDPLTSHNFLNPATINPAFTSFAEDPSVSLNFRDQSPQQAYKYINYNITYLHPSEFLGGGAGFIFKGEHQGNGILSKYFISGLYSYRLQVSKSFFLHAGFQASLGYRNLNTTNLIFENGNEVVENENKFFPDFSIGFMGEAKEHTFGMSVDHLTQPAEASSSDSIITRLLRKYTIHYKYNFVIKDARGAFNSIILSPTIFYQAQGTFQHLSYGLCANLYPALVNVGVRQDMKMNFECVNFAFGIIQPKYLIVYSYDLSLAGLKNMTQFNAHEVTFLLNLQYKQKSKKHKAIKCPKF
jgi:type IX secretion system PorP/SprF family membrane protein